MKEEVLGDHAGCVEVPACSTCRGTVWLYLTLEFDLQTDSGRRCLASELVCCSMGEVTLLKCVSVDRKETINVFTNIVQNILLSMYQSVMICQECYEQVIPLKMIPN